MKATSADGGLAMIRNGDNKMGRFAVDFEVANREDVFLARKGLLPEAKVRRLKIRGVVDSGATQLVLPKSVVTKLGLSPSGKVKVKYADRRSATRDTVDDVQVEILGRNATFRAVVEPSRTEALIGAIVLEALDYLVDCTHQRLVPRDPKFVISEIE
jgi:clan AA aspartic protease